MSNYLGFEPTDNPYYYFVSYNNEDAERVGIITQRLSHSNMPLWYDHGIEYGEAWESKITEKLAKAQAVLLFFTKGILLKENSYVRKEYKMATEYFDKKVYIVMLDSIDKKEVPFDKVSWFIDIQEKQNINVFSVNDLDAISNTIMSAVGVSTHEDKMNTIIENYRSLYEFGKTEEAEKYLAEYLKGKSLSAKAKCIANLFSGEFSEITQGIFSQQYITKLENPLRNHMGDLVDGFFEGQRFAAGDNIFTFGNSVVFHRGCLGDAHVINIWRNEDNIYTIGGLVEAHDMRVYYDNMDDIIYVIYVSDKEIREGAEVTEIPYLNVTTIERPLGDAVCNTFKWLVEL